MGPKNYRKENRNTHGVCGFCLLNSGGPVNFNLSLYQVTLLYERKIGSGRACGFPVNNGYTLN